MTGIQIEISELSIEICSSNYNDLLSWKHNIAILTMYISSNMKNVAISTSLPIVKGFFHSVPQSEYDPE